MSRCKQDRKKTPAYVRIMEILDDYWLSVPDESFVEVEMHFYKSDGQQQHKRICWRNPDKDI